MGFKARSQPTIDRVLFELSRHSRASLAQLGDLLSRGANANSRHEPEGMSPLWTFAFTGHQEAFEMCMEAGADINQRVEGAGCAWVRMLMNSQDEQLLVRMIAHGARLEERWSNGATCVHLLVQRRTPRSTWLAVRSAGADPGARDDRGETALFSAVRAGNIRAVQLLLEWGVDLSVKNHLGQTALSLAVVRREIGCVRRMVNAGFGLPSGHSFAVDAYEIAIASGFKAIARVLGGRRAGKDAAEHPNAAGARLVEDEIRARLIAGECWELGNREWVSAVRFRNGEFQAGEWDLFGYDPKDESCWTLLPSFAVALKRMKDASRQHDVDDGVLEVLKRVRAQLR